MSIEVKLDVTSNTKFGSYLLVLIDHHAATIIQINFGSAKNGFPPNDIYDTYRDYCLHKETLFHFADLQFMSTNIFEAVAIALTEANQILVVGNEDDRDEYRALDLLLDEISENHSDVADRVVGAVLVKAQVAQNELCILATKAFASLRSGEVPWIASFSNSEKPTTLIY